MSDRNSLNLCRSSRHATRGLARNNIPGCTASPATTHASVAKIMPFSSMPVLCAVSR